MTQEEMSETLDLSLQVYRRKESGRQGFANRGELVRGISRLELSCQNPDDPLQTWLNTALTTIAIEAHQPTWASQVLRPLGYDGADDPARQIEWALARLEPRKAGPLVVEVTGSTPRKRRGR